MSDPLEDSGVSSTSSIFFFTLKLCQSHLISTDFAKISEDHKYAVILLCTVVVLKYCYMAGFSLAMSVKIITTDQSVVLVFKAHFL